MWKTESKVTFDHDEIRRQAEELGASLACARGTGGRGDIEMIRLDFPGYPGEHSVQYIDWEQWSQKLDKRNLALFYQEATAAGQTSNSNKLVSRETAEGAEEYGHSKRVGSPAKKKSSESEPQHPERAQVVRKCATARKQNATAKAK